MGALREENKRLRNALRHARVYCNHAAEHYPDGSLRRMFKHVVSLIDDYASAGGEK
jgi:hypothetical protein